MCFVAYGPQAQREAFTVHFAVQYIEAYHNCFLYIAGVIPRSLPASACTQVPKFGLEVIGKSMSMPEQQMQHQQHLPQSQSQQHPLSQDIKKITTSVSTLRIPNQKPQSDKVHSDTRVVCTSTGGQLKVFFIIDGVLVSFLLSKLGPHYGYVGCLSP